MEAAVTVILVFMILGAIFAIHAKDLLSAVIACGIVGYGLVICFLLLKAPDLAIVQIVVETISLVLMVAVVIDSTREEPYTKTDRQGYVTMATAILIVGVIFYFLNLATRSLDAFGEGSLRMAEHYITGAAEKTGSANLVTGVIFDFRGFDTLGEATVLITAVLGVLTILRIKGKKEDKPGQIPSREGQVNKE